MKNKIFGFSLAEMMIVLLMIAVTLAATAPIITKKVSLNKSDKVFEPLANPAWSRNAVFYVKGTGDGDRKQKIFMTNEGADGGIGITTANVSEMEPYSILLGDTEPSDSSVSVGYKAATGVGSVAIGSGSTAIGDHSVAIGNGNQQGYLNGDGPYAAQFGGVAIGYNAHSTGTNSAIAIGHNATTAGNHGAVSIGLSSQASGDYSTAVGREARATQHAASAYGIRAIAEGQYATAVGHDAQAKGNNSTALAVSSRANGYASTAIGHDAQAINSSTTAVGLSSRANGYASTAVGQNARATNTNTLALGNNSYAHHYNSMAIGQWAESRGDNRIVLGTSWHTVKIPGALETQNLTIPGDLLVKGDVALATDPGHNIYMRENGEEVHEYCKFRFIWCWSWGEYYTPQQRLTRIEGTAAAFETEDNSQEVFHICDDCTRAMVHGIASDGNVWINSERISDRRVKNVGEKYTYGLDALKQLDFYHYSFKNDKTNAPYVGVMAQDLQKVFPESVTTNEKSGYLQIRWDEMFYATINAVKELNERLIALTNKVQDIIKDMTDIKTVVAKHQQLLDEHQQSLTDSDQKITDLTMKVEKLEKQK